VGCAQRTLIIPEKASLPLIYDDHSQAWKDLETIVTASNGMDVVFIGEIHDDNLTHQMEFELLKRLHKKKSHLAVAMEMFERDVQSVLNEYLDGKISEKDFLSNSRPWNNYRKAYRPLVEYAKEKDLPVLAMNVPRKYAGQLAMRGESFLVTISDSEKVWIARELKVLDDEYKARFLETIQNRPHPMARMDPMNLYRAQSLKDDTMAESIADFLESHPGIQVISFQGDFHSAFGLGIVKKLRLLRPGIKVMVISIIPIQNLDSLDPADYRGQGDYLIFVRRFKQS
jgi:uncharacterized iron-regulated protein